MLQLHLFNVLCVCFNYLNALCFESRRLASLCILYIRLISIEVINSLMSIAMISKKCMEIVINTGYMWIRFFCLLYCTEYSVHRFYFFDSIIVCAIIALNSFELHWTNSISMHVTAIESEQSVYNWFEDVLGILKSEMYLACVWCVYLTTMRHQSS